MLKKEIKGTKWDDMDDQLIMEQGFPDYQLSNMLNRSIKAIKSRRYRLKQKKLKETFHVKATYEWKELNEQLDKIEKELDEETTKEFVTPIVTTLNDMTQLNAKIGAIEHDIVELKEKQSYDHEWLIDQISNYLELMRKDIDTKMSKKYIKKPFVSNLLVPDIQMFDGIVNLYNTVKKFLYDNTYWQSWTGMMLMVLAFAPFKIEISIGLMIGGLLMMYVIMPVMIHMLEKYWDDK